MNQMFRIVVEVEITVRPRLNNVDRKTVEACAIHKVANAIDKSKCGAVEVRNARVIDEKPIPVGKPAGNPGYCDCGQLATHTHGIAGNRACCGFCCTREILS